MGESAEPFKHQLAYDEQRSLYDYWRSKCRPGVLPMRHDLHPKDMIQLLPFITLTDVSSKEHQHIFRVRLAGTGLRSILDTEITGQRLDDLPFGKALSHWQSIHEQIVTERKPMCGVMPFIWHGRGRNIRSALAQFWVKFPLQSENGVVSSILAYDIFTPLENLSSGLTLNSAIA
jgi:hypothetical protein